MKTATKPTVKKTVKATKKPAVKKTVVASVAPTIAALEVAYRDIAADVLAKQGVVLPEAVITVQRSKKSWGHITLWTPWSELTGKSGRVEIMVSGENLKRGATEVFGTLLHEAAHAFNLAQGISDTSANQYHNRRFKEAAELLGLEVHKLGTKGFARTTVPAATAARWAQSIKTLDAAISVAATPEPAKAKPERDTNAKKAMCGCASNNIIRTSKARLAAGITCNICDEKFEEVVR